MPRGRFEDLTGRVFNRLTVVELLPRTPGMGALWRCRCACGNEVQTVTRLLNRGNTGSCGCYARQRQSETATRIKRRHGHSHTPTHRVWSAMLDRCRNPNTRDYARYGGRGIAVCDRWLVYENFISDMGLQPPGRSLERIDNDAGYGPENCRWATRSEQARNTRTNRIIEWRGKRKVLAEWSEITGLASGCIRFRLDRGWSVEEALTAPPRSVRH